MTEEFKVKPDVDFFNLLIKKRQMRLDHVAVKVGCKSYILISFDYLTLINDVNQLAGSDGLFTNTQTLSEYYDIWCSRPWMPHDSRYYQINDNDGRVRIQVSMSYFNNLKIIC